MVPRRKKGSWEREFRLARTWLMEMVEMSRESRRMVPVVALRVRKRMLRRELLPL